jgi:DNA-binding CsgD family transcriptional regulator
MPATIAATCLAERELAVALAVARGHALEEMATWFDETVAQVGWHLERACHKLGTHPSELPLLLGRWAC